MDRSLSPGPSQSILMVVAAAQEQITKLADAEPHRGVLGAVAPRDLGRPRRGCFGPLGRCDRCGRFVVVLRGCYLRGHPIIAPSPQNVHLTLKGLSSQPAPSHTSGLIRSVGAAENGISTVAI